MFEYFPDNYWWSLMVCNSLGMGGEISEIDRACAGLRSLSGGHIGDREKAAWTAAWLELGQRVERLAERDHERGLMASAARKYLRAASYLFVAEAVTPHGDPRKPQVYKAAQDAFRAGARLTAPEVEFVEVPFEGASLPALFVPAHGVDGPAPCLVHFDGTHDVKEVTYLRHRDGLARRGVSLLIVDHPGSGEALRLRGLLARPDIEVPATACVDYLEDRADVDPEEIGIIAQSLGGYYAPRAAAFEKRFKVCVVWGAIWSAYEAFAEVGAAFEPSEFPLLGVSDRDSVIERLKQFTLDGGVIEQVECPLLIIHGENDRQCRLWTAKQTYERATASPRRELRVFTAEEGGDEHCQVDLFAQATDYIHDWLALFFADRAAARTQASGAGAGAGS
jgi:dienelactone hydrolase